ncbi:PREDICTED: B3 domain-containing protein At5g24050-like [Erythranthe guttata]|nr:PREDICTED: B3 domain-containing protein At5g24050-like [Erythranthe guttata]|eukprot:XP_012846833.1 PREDICTED: B3 domain-containing protein At5g24050-like [Erythranthe guttata]
MLCKKMFNALVEVAFQKSQEDLIKAEQQTQSKANTSSFPFNPPRRPRTKREEIINKHVIETADDSKVEDEEEQEEDQEYSDKKAKKRKSSDNLKKKKEAIGNGPPTPPPLPEEFKKTIQEIGKGKNLSEEAEMKLVIQKGLFETDLAPGNNRLSIPFTRVRDHGFLTEEEARFLTTRDRNNKMKFKDVTIIEPSLRREKVKLSRWDMKKGNGKNTWSNYVINGKWRHIVERNRLEPGDVVQLWSFRIDQELHFALVKLPGNN